LHDTSWTIMLIMPSVIFNFQLLKIHVRIPFIYLPMSCPDEINEVNPKYEIFDLTTSFDDFT
jgi:hypothetical protein